MDAIPRQVASHRNAVSGWNCARNPQCDRVITPATYGITGSTRCDGICGEQ